MKYENKKEAFAICQKIESLERFVARLDESGIKTTVSTHFNSDVSNILDYDQRQELKPLEEKYLSSLLEWAAQEIARNKEMLETL